MAELPSGTVTILFTDLEGSTRLWDELPDSMEGALARHDEILREVIAAHDGYVVKTTGDGVHAVFARASDALSAATGAQLALDREVWGATGKLQVRMGVHTTEATQRDGDYFGSGVNRAARLMAVAHGGQIVCSQSTAELVRDQLDEGIALVDLGEHRLRDLSRAERVFQLSGGGLADGFPPLKSLDLYPTNLPAQLSAFIGRDAEVASVSAALREARLVTLTGVGGVGKTRLALQVAAAVLPEYTNGAWLVELGGLSDPDSLPAAVASALRVPQQPGSTVVETLAAALAGRLTLLLLDNCEHLLDGVAVLVRALTGAAPDLHVLCTSREALGVQGERILAVQPLPVPATDEADDTVAVTDAVRLFVERARAVRGSFRLGHENAGDVVRICRRVDGIPLAIELAAARVRSMAPADIAARLDQRFQLLSGGTRGAVNRHQTLRRAIDWSYELLAPEEAELLQRLSVCVGGFDLDAAEAIGTSGTIESFAVVDLLDRLVDKSLLDVDDVGAETRYRLLETIREYAFERLEAAGQVDEVRARHAEHYVTFAEAAGAGLRGPDEPMWLERAERDLDNVRAAVVWSTDTEGGALALRVLASLGVHGVRVEAVVCSWSASVAAAVEAASAPRPPDDPLYPAALSLVAWRALRDGDLERARQIGERALHEATGDTPESIWARCLVLATTTAVHVYGGSVDQEQPAEWVTLAQRINEQYEEALAWCMLAVHRMFGGSDGAVEAGEEGVRVARACGSPTALSFTLLTLGQVVGTDDPARAVLLFDEAIACADLAANEWAGSAAAGARGSVLSEWGDNAAACQAMLESTTRALNPRHRVTVAQSLLAVATHLEIEGDHETASIIDGYARTILGDNPGPGWSVAANAARVALVARSSDEYYAALAAQGAAMSDEQIVEFATKAVERLPG